MVQIIYSHVRFGACPLCPADQCPAAGQVDVGGRILRYNTQSCALQGICEAPLSIFLLHRKAMCKACQSSL